MHIPAAKNWHFDVDEYLNPFIPRNRLHRLPKPIANILGSRDHPREQIGNLLVAAWACLGAFVGVIIIEATFMIPAIKDHGVPLLIASFGAAAILEFNTIESPLAQPRNTIIGHFLAALVGVGITKLFSLRSDFENLRWLAGALACGLASALMTITKTVYPPAGATALLAAMDPQVEQLGWFLLPLVILSAALTLIVSLLINNIQRQYPIYWWTSAKLEAKRTVHDIEKESLSTNISLNTEPRYVEDNEGPTIRITPERTTVPKNIYLPGEERGILEILRDRLREGLPRAPEPAVQY